MKRLMLLFGCLFIITTVYAQQVAGYVYDKEDGNPLTGVTVSYKYKDVLKGCATDVNGYYEIDVPQDAITLSFSYVGYSTENYPMVISGKKVINRNVYLKPNAKLLEEVVVSVGRFEQKLSDITVSMEVIKPKDITNQSPTDLRAVLNTIPGVDVTDKQPSIRGGSGWTYGVGSRSQVLVDGMSILTPGVGEINWNTIPLENIQQVEVIKGASSVLYGSSALNGLINVRTKRPNLEPETNISTYIGIYGNPDNSEHTWWDKSFWKADKYPVEPVLRRTLLSGVRNPLYDGMDISHSRRIGDFDVTGSMNLFTDEGFRKGDYNKRVRVGGNLTYHHPGANKLNYGFNINALSNEYGDFFIWRSPSKAYESSPVANMGREHNMIYIDPFLNFYNESNQTSHKIKGRFYYKSDNIVHNSDDRNFMDIMNNMGVDGNSINGIIDVIKNPEQLLPPLLPPLLNNDLNGAVNAVKKMGKQYFPNGKQEDYVDLISWFMNNPLPGNENDIPQWLLNTISPQNEPTKTDKTSSYFLDYQFSKRFTDTSILTLGSTYEHVETRSSVTGDHKSDNVALFSQYDHEFFDKLNLSLGMRMEYYRVDSHKREAETRFFGKKIPIKPIFRGGLSYELADYTFIRASFGQGYRYPSLTEKFIVKDIGGVGAYPNSNLKAERGYNAEIGIRQGYKLGPFIGYLDLAAFYTYYKDMIEFDFGLINPSKELDYPFIKSLREVGEMIAGGDFPTIGVKFSNVNRARIYGLDFSVNGFCNIRPNMKLFYTMGYTFTEPRDVDAKKRNAQEEANIDILAMKSKSNTSKYLKYRQKNTVKATFDLEWGRFNIGTNLLWKSKTLAVDYLMVDERSKIEPDAMDHVRSLLFGDLDGYWKDKNDGIFTMDLRFGAKVTRNVSFQIMINNLLNNEYSLRPMDVSAPRTFIMKCNIKL